MIFTELRLPGAFTIDIEQMRDERGFFARTWSPDEFEAHGLSTVVAQASIAYNTRRDTLRGLHYQEPPYAETKLVRCSRGAVYDVIVDIRPGSATFGEWVGVELSAENRRTLYVPEGFAHGYQTLTDDTEVWYQMSAAYAPGAARGIRFDDPRLAIEWPAATERIVSGRDRCWPALQA
ncbi:MAG: dTDP-4-dehydrorhamnose 3,5-epimerase [Gaiellaceae bacterium]|jgi:dTDP-4-dehydrorhamnose 3,5-epimerase|nr:dTDP-4-dehydrorhamnose 3,5-epimerase [Gaiellaceae bacterium]